METAAPLPVDKAAASSGERRRTSVWGLVASVILHGAASACVVAWDWDRAAAPPALEVAIVWEAAPAARPAIEATPDAPPAAPSRPEAVASPPPPTPAVLPKHEPPAPTPPPRPQRKPPPIPRPQPVVSDAVEPVAAATPATDAAAENDGKAAAAATGSSMVGAANSLEGRREARAAADAVAAAVAGNPAPSYPMAARRAGREGRTVLLVVVDAAGECRDVRVTESSGTPSLDAAAVAAVRRWRFTPAMEAGRAVEATISVPISFKLTGAS